MKDCFSIMWSYMYVWLHIVTHHSRFFLPFLVTFETDTQTHKYIEMQTLNVCAGSISVISSEIRTSSAISSRFCYVQYAPFTFGVGMDLLPWGMGLNTTEYLMLFSWVAVIMGKKILDTKFGKRRIGYGRLSYARHFAAAAATDEICVVPTWL